jgi:uncharacterized protein (TIGR03000 family)
MHGDFHHGDFNHDGFHHSHFFFGGYPYYDYGFGYYPYSTGFWGGYGYPGYYSYPYYSSDYYTYPYASDSVMPDTYGYYPAYSAADAAGYAPAGVAGGWDQSDQRVMARIVLPTPDAQLWVEGQEMTSTGTVRSFVSPSLEPGKYTYTFRVRWTEGGRMMEQTRKVGVHPGDRITVDFSTEEQISMPKSKP